MIRELYTEDLDINLKYNVYLQCVQNDDIILNINVYDKSIQADLNNYTCRLKALKSDQIPLIQNTNININKNVVTIEANKQLTTTAGIVKAELQFTDKSTLKKKSTFFIEIKVEKSSLNVDGAVSTPLCTLLEEIDNKLDQIENIGLVLDEAKQVRDTLESDIVVANTTNENIVQSISDADSKKREVEISISNASDKISEVEDSITNADNSRNALDRSKEVADETKIDLDNANVQAEKNIEELNKLGDVTDLAAKVGTNTENISKNTKDIEKVNSQLNERAIKTYYNLSQIGLTDSNLSGKTQNEIADIIINAMPNNSTLELYLSGTTTTNIGILLPIRYDGILRIYKDTIKGCKFSFTSQTNRTFDSFYASWKTPTLVGWNEIASGDTGWIDLVLNSGIIARTGATPQIRRIGKQVFLRGAILAKCLSNTSNIALFAIPAGFIPNKLVEFTSISALSLFVDCYILQSNGTVNARISAVTTNESHYFFLDDCASWLVD